MPAGWASQRAWNRFPIPLPLDTSALMGVYAYLPAQPVSDPFMPGKRSGTNGSFSPPPAVRRLWRRTAGGGENKP